jgi:hypothetical protein
LAADVPELLAASGREFDYSLLCLLDAGTNSFKLGVNQALSLFQCLIRGRASGFHFLTRHKSELFGNLGESREVYLTYGCLDFFRQLFGLLSLFVQN